MSIVRELVTLFSFDTDERGITQAENAVSGLRDQLFALLAAGAAAGASLFGLAQSTANYADDAVKTAERLGLTVERLQELDFALGINGTSFAEQRVSFQRLAGVAADAAAGVQGARDSFDAIGVSVTDSAGNLRSIDDLLLSVADGMAGLDNDTQRAALAQDLFGRSGGTLLTFLRNGSAGIQDLAAEARDLGGVLSTEDARGAEAFNDEMLRLRTFVRGLKNDIGIGLIPIIREQITAVREWGQQNRELISAKLAEFIGAVKTIAMAGVRTFLILARIVEWITGLFGGLEGTLKLIRNAFIALALYRVVAAMQVLTISVSAAAMAFRAKAVAAWQARSAVLGAQAATMLYVASLLAIVAAIVLVVDDFRRFANGQDSLIGRLVAQAETMADGFTGPFGAVLAFLRDLRDEGEIAFQLMAFDVGAFVQVAVDLFENFRDNVFLVFDDISSKGADVIGSVAGLFQNREQRQAIQELAQADRDRRQRIRDGLNGATVIQDFQNRGQDRQALAEELRLQREERRNGTNGNITQTTTVEINGSSLSPDQLTDAVSTGVSQSNEDLLREINRGLSQTGG